MQSNPPLSPGCECMSGMRGPLKSFPLHCSTNRLVLCREAIQLHCWALPVCVCVCACVCFPLAWQDPYQYSSLNSFSPALFICWISSPILFLYPVLLSFAVMKTYLCCCALPALFLHASLRLAWAANLLMCLCNLNCQNQNQVLGQVCWHKQGNWLWLSVTFSVPENKSKHTANKIFKKATLYKWV